MPAITNGAQAKAKEINPKVKMATLSADFDVIGQAWKPKSIGARLQGFELIPKVVTGVQFVDGEEQTQRAA